MSMKYIRDYYHVPAKRGARIKFLGDVDYRDTLYGTITSAKNARIMVRFDTNHYGNHPVPLHPTWEVEYLPETVANETQMP